MDLINFYDAKKNSHYDSLSEEFENNIFENYFILYPSLSLEEAEKRYKKRDNLNKIIGAICTIFVIIIFPLLYNRPDYNYEYKN